MSKPTTSRACHPSRIPSSSGPSSTLAHSPSPIPLRHQCPPAAPVPCPVPHSLTLCLSHLAELSSGTLRHLPRLPPLGKVTNWTDWCHSGSPETPPGSRSWSQPLRWEVGVVATPLLPPTLGPCTPPSHHSTCKSNSSSVAPAMSPVGLNPVTVRWVHLWGSGEN